MMVVVMMMVVMMMIRLWEQIYVARFTLSNMTFKNTFKTLANVSYVKLQFNKVNFNLLL